MKTREHLMEFIQKQAFIFITEDGLNMKVLCS